VVRVTAAILGVSEDEVRADRGRYAVLHWDDGFVDECLDDIEWIRLRLDADPEPHEMYGRADFDLSRSRFAFDDGLEVVDRGVKELLRKQDGFLYGDQLQTLVTEHRLEPVDIGHCFEVEGRVRAKDSLIDAMTALLLLADRPLLQPGEYAETDPRWAPMLAGIEDEALRAHLSLFFQEANAARCSGAYYDDDADADDDPMYERLRSWSIGEGQGAFTLARIRDDTIPPAPPKKRAK
jgi:hypothetical protein